MKYFIYARKSTDEPERQVLSIEAQITELKELAEREHIEIVNTFIESQTAKEPGRPIFNDMLSRMEKGEAEGILAWHPDRLARNSVDGGRVIYLIDTAHITALKFPTFWFDPTPQGKFMLSIAFGQSKYYIDNLSENVKRGLRQKVRHGEQVGVAPTGYLNDKLNHKIIPDPNKIPLIQKLFEMYETGNHSIKSLRKIINDLGLTSRNNKPLSVSNVQFILSSPFYYGAFMFKGELHQGKHEPAISKKLFDKCQEVMQSRYHKVTRGAKEYVFRGFLKCGECGCSITSETQKGHDYYRCTKKNDNCSQKYIREESLAANISEILQKVSLNSDWADDMIQTLNNEKQDTAQSDTLFAQKIKNEIKECDEKLQDLLDLMLEKVISKDEYTAKKQTVLNQKIDIQEKLNDFEQKGNCWLERARTYILDAKQAKIITLNKNFSEMKNFLKKIGSNPLLREREISISLKNEWKILENFNSEFLKFGQKIPQNLIFQRKLRDLDSD